MEFVTLGSIESLHAENGTVKYLLPRIELLPFSSVDHKQVQTANVWLNKCKCEMLLDI